MEVDPNWMNNPKHYGHLWWVGKGIMYAGFWVGMGMMMFGFSYCSAHISSKSITPVNSTLGQ